MTSATKANLAKTVEMPVVLLYERRSHYTEIELSVLCYLADSFANSSSDARDIVELRSSDLVTTSSELEAVQ